MPKPQPSIPQELWCDLQAMEHTRFTLRQMADWLIEEHNLTVDVSTVSRTLARIRELAPPPELKLPPLAPNLPALTVTLEPQSEEDEFKLIRRRIRDQIFDDGLSPKDQQSAVRVLYQVLDRMKAERASKGKNKAATEQPAPATDWAPSFGVVKN